MNPSGLMRSVISSPAVGRLCLMLALAAALTVVLGARADAATAHATGLQTVSGILSVIEGDAFGRLGVGGPHRIKAYVVDAQDGSRSTPVALSPAQIRQAGGLQALKNRRVTITGTPAGGAAAPGQAPGEPAPLMAQSLSVTSDRPVTATATATAGATAASTSVASSAAIIGAMPVLNIMCKFADIADEPKDAAYFDGLVGDSYPGLGHYWRENSYNAITLTGSASTGWLTLPSPRVTYVGTAANLDLLYTDCRRQAVNAGRDPSAFAALNLMFNGPLDCSPSCASWGSADFRGERVTWLHPSAYESQAHVAHEMGHAFGLHHSNFNGGAPDDSCWDVMSGFQFANIVHPTFNNLGWHTIGYHKDVLGWMPAAQKYVVPAGSTRTITLERSAQPATANPRMVQVAAGSGRFFTVEARKPVGYDAGKGDAVIIHEVVPARITPAGVPEPAWVMGGSDGCGGAMWTVGESFIDPASGTSVRVDSATASGFVVTVGSGLKVLTVSRSGQGKVTGPGIACGTGAGTDCSEAYLPGTVVTLTATAFTNPRIGEVWTFDHWEGACTGTAKTCTVTMSAARSATAVFVDFSE